MRAAGRQPFIRHRERLHHLAGGEVRAANFRNGLQLQIDLAGGSKRVAGSFEIAQRLFGLAQILQRDRVVEHQVGNVVARQHVGERKRCGEALPGVRIVALDRVCKACFVQHQRLLGALSGFPEQVRSLSKPFQSGPVLLQLDVEIADLKKRDRGQLVVGDRFPVGKRGLEIREGALEPLIVRVEDAGIRGAVSCATLLREPPAVVVLLECLFARFICGRDLDEQSVRSGGCPLVTRADGQRERAGAGTRPEQELRSVLAQSILFTNRSARAVHHGDRRVDAELFDRDPHTLFTAQRQLIGVRLSTGQVTFDGHARRHDLPDGSRASLAGACRASMASAPESESTHRTPSACAGIDRCVRRVCSCNQILQQTCASRF